MQNKTLLRRVLAPLAVGTMLFMSGCASGTNVPTPGESPDATPLAVEVDEGLLTVDMRIARSLLDPNGDLTDEAIVESAGTQGITAVIDGDVVVYTMTKSQRNQMLEDMRSSVRETLDEMIADGSNSITDAEFDDAMTSFTVKVDAARYSEFESLLALGFYIPGALFQQFSGTSPDDVDVIVEFVDDATGAVLNTGSYADMREKLSQ